MEIYSTIQFISKSVILAGTIALSCQQYDAITYKREVFVIDAVTSAGHSSLVKQQEISCRESKECSTMSIAVYHEARGEGWNGMKAVANVIKNRVESSKFKNTVVDVVHRPWQFSYVHELDNKEPRDLRSYKKALVISHRVLTGKVEDNTMGSTHYLAPKKLKKLPRWARKYERTVAINNHVFFRG